MRLNLATDYKTRTGAPDKDAKQKNSYVEIKNQQAVVRKRPGARGGIVTGFGTAQGGIGFNIGSTSYVYTFNGDVGTLNSMSTLGAWNPTTSYTIGAAVWWPIVGDPFVDPQTVYYAALPSVGQVPGTPGSFFWSTTPIGTARYQGTYLSALGPIGGTIAAAGWGAWNLNESYKTCATKNPVTWVYRTFDHTDLNTMLIYIHQWTDGSPLGNCTAAPLDFGVVSAGSVAQV